MYNRFRIGVLLPIGLYIILPVAQRSGENVGGFGIFMRV